MFEGVTTLIGESLIDDIFTLFVNTEVLALVSPIFILLFSLFKDKTGLTTLFTIISVLSGVLIGSLLFAILSLSELSNIKWEVLTGFSLGYSIELSIILVRWGTKNIDPSSDLNINAKDSNIAPQIFAAHALLGAGLFLSFLFAPKSYIPALATGFGVVLLNFTRQMLSNDRIQTISNKIEEF